MASVLSCTVWFPSMLSLGSLPVTSFGSVALRPPSCRKSPCGPLRSTCTRSGLAFMPPRRNQPKEVPAMAKATTTTAQAEKKPATGINLVRIGGRLAADPELRHSANGLAHCKLRVADNTGKVAQFHPVVIFEQLAEQAAESFKKG